MISVKQSNYVSFVMVLLTVKLEKEAIAANTVTMDQTFNFPLFFFK